MFSTHTVPDLNVTVPDMDDKGLRLRPYQVVWLLELKR
jgi:hypothetical protein